MTTRAKEIQLRGDSVLQLPFTPPRSLYGAKLGDLNDVDATDVTDGKVVTRQSDGSFALEDLPAGLGAPHFGFRANYYYSSFNGWTAGTRTLAANRLFYVPFFVPQATTWTRIGVNVATPAAGTTIRLGIYNNGNGVPTGAPRLDAGTVSAATTGEKELTISHALDVGWYWLAVVSNGTAAITAESNASLGFRPNMGFATGAGTGYAMMQEDITYGSLPSVGSPVDGALSLSPFRIWLRVVPFVATPATPANLRQTACSDGASTIAWDASAGATTYILEYSATIGGTYTQVYLGAGSTTTIDIGSGGVTGFWFRVSASNGGGQSAPSSPVQIACNYF
jgi:hypothetical protein